MGEFSLMHWVLVLGIVLLFFGPSKLPQLGRSLGEAIRGFKKGISELDEEKNQQPPQQLKQGDQSQQIASEQQQKTTDRK